MRAAPDIDADVAPESNGRIHMAREQQRAVRAARVAEKEVAGNGLELGAQGECPDSRVGSC